MHYYSFHIGDYRAATAHLTNEEDLAYRRLIDMYYDTELPIPTDLTWVSRRLRISIDSVKSVLEDMFVLTDEGWENERCSMEIKAYKRMIEGGRQGAAKRWAKGDDAPPNTPPKQTPMPTMNHEPITIVETKAKRTRGTRLPDNWKPSAELIAWATQERSDLNLQQITETFCDYWHSAAGSNASKLDWDATFRVWVRKQHSPSGKQSVTAQRSLAGYV